MQACVGGWVGARAGVRACERASEGAGTGGAVFLRSAGAYTRGSKKFFGVFDCQLLVKMSSNKISPIATGSQKKDGKSDFLFDTDPIIALSRTRNANQPH